MKVLMYFSFLFLAVFGYDFIPPCSRGIQSIHWSPPFECQNGYRIGNLTTTRRLVHTTCPSELVTVRCVQSTIQTENKKQFPVQTLTISLIAMVLPVVVCFFNHVEPKEPDHTLLLPRPRLLA